MELSEVLAALAAIVLGLWTWGRWLIRLFAVNRLVAGPGSSWLVPTALGAFTVINFVGLRTLAAGDVRDDPTYLAFYSILGLGVSGVTLLGLGLFGVQPADVSQRHNRAAAIFVALAVIASAFAYMGANIGDGPGFHVVLFSAMLSMGALFAVMALHAAIAHTAYRILVERQVGSAFRTGCLLVACGICLGRAVAGTWVGVESTLSDFVHYGWPAVVLCAADVVLARMTRAVDASYGLPIDLVAGGAEIAFAVEYLRAVGIPA